MRIWTLLAILTAAMTASAEDLVPELAVVEKVGKPTPHWLVLNDPNFLGYLDSKVYLIDTDDGRMLGMLSTGAWHSATEFSPQFDMLYSPETYYSRGNEGERTDVLRFYDVENLTAQGEVVIPPKRGAGAPHRAYSGRSDDGRFVYIVNMTPAMSVTVVDVGARKVAAEVATPGCTMVYPTGDRSFASLCGNGTVLHTSLNDDGTRKGSNTTEVFFDANTDPLTEKADRIGDVWYFVSFSGRVYELSATDSGVSLGESWSVSSRSEHGNGWRPGGAHFVAAHPQAGLFVGMNSQGDDSHKVSAEEIWQFDLETRKRVRKLALDEPVARIAVSRDSAPVLAAATEGPEIYLFDGLTGERTGSLEAPLLGAGVLQFVEVQ